MMRSEYANTMSMSCSTWTMALSPTRFDAATSVSMIAVLSAVLTPRGGLVEQDDLRLERERRSDVQELLVSLGQLSRRNVSLVPEPEQLGDLEGALLNRTVARQRREEVAPAPESRDHGRLQGLQHREIGEDLHELERASDAEPRQARRADATDVAILESDVARARPRHAREDVDQGRLAGSVGPDDRDELTRGDPEAHAVERAELSVEFGEPGRLEDHARAGEPGRRRDTRPTSPSGAKITMTASIAPKTSRQ